MKKKKLSGLNLNKKTISALKDSVTTRLMGGQTEDPVACGATEYISCAVACGGGTGGGGASYNTYCCATDPLRC
jgi:hypothetical protein